MFRVSVEEATRNLKALLERVAKGEEVIIVEQGKAVACLVPLQAKQQWLASMEVFRDSLQVEGEPLSTTVIKARQEERY